MNEEEKREKFYNDALTELAEIGTIETSCIYRDDIEFYKVKINRGNKEYSCENLDSKEAVIQLRNIVIG